MPALVVATNRSMAGPPTLVTRTLLWLRTLMHVLVATDGHLDADKAARLVARLVEPDDRVTVLTAIEEPDHPPDGTPPETGVNRVARIAHEAGPGMTGMASGAVAAERLSQLMPVDEKAPDEPVHRYFTTTAQRRLDDVLGRLREHGVEARPRWTLNEGRTSSRILGAVESEAVDLVVMGGGQRRFRGFLGSTVSRVLEQAEIPVLVVK